MLDDVIYRQTAYLTSAAELDQLTEDTGSEVAFIGRSNAGKSSALNTITGLKGLARTSKTPGRTQMINFFSIDAGRRLVDLPGYGYAKVPLVIKERWMENIEEYLRIRRSLRGLMVVMDIRHPLKDMDLELIDWAVACEVPLHILLTKADKLKSNAAKKILKEVSTALKHYEGHITLQLFSSQDRTGLEEAHTVLNHWFSI